MQPWSVLVTLALAALAQGKEWTIDESTADLVLMGLGAADATHGVAGTCSSSGAEPSFYNGTAWGKTHNSPSGVIMDMAATPGNELSVYTSFGGPWVSTDQGASWTRGGSVIGVAQSVQVFNNSKAIGITGQLTIPGQGTVNGVMVTSDGQGAQWEAYGIEGAIYPRYGSFPSATTWYVTEGTWPETSHAKPFLHAFTHLKEGLDISPRIRIGAVGSGVTKRGGQEKPASLGWMSKVWKTTDGGSTWTNVFSSKPSDAYCFNAISCPTEDRCVAVADGGEGSDMTVYAYMTQNGGETWTKVFESDKYESLMAVTFTSETEGWIAPSGYTQSDNGLGVVTDFMQTTDGGATWTLGQSLEGCISTDMETAETLTLSTCLMEGGVQSRVATYA